MCLAITLFNFLTASANGKAVTLLPIMGPLGDIIGVNRQVLVLAFNYGDGFTKWLWPTSAVIVGSLGAANIEYSAWVKWTWKFFLLMTVVSFACVGTAQTMNLGPF